MDDTYDQGQYLDPTDKGIPKATGFSERLLGLMGERGAKIGALYFPKCWSVQTFGMKTKLRITYIDSNCKIIRSKVVPPKRICISPKHTVAVVEEVIENS